MMVWKGTAGGRKCAGKAPMRSRQRNKYNLKGMRGKGKKKDEVTHNI